VSHSTTTQKSILIFTGLLLGLIGLSLASLCFGGSGIKPQDILSALFNPTESDPIIRQILIELRIPRILTAMLAGASLATAGLLMQTVFRNPLADPFILGVNSGASLGVALVLLTLAPLSIHIGQDISQNMSFAGQFTLISASSGGAALTLFAVLWLSRKVEMMSVLIIGLMISYTAGALISMLMFFTIAERLQSFISWSFGNYGSVNWSTMPIFALTTLIGLLLSALLVKPLDALLLGEHYAESVGVRVKQVRITILFAASLLAGTITAFCGPIGFLGIAAPHISRYLFQTSRHLTLLSASILIGALLSLCSDFIARGPGLDTTLPLNAITALVGAPIIIIVLIRQRNFKQRLP